MTRAAGTNSLPLGVQPRRCAAVMLAGLCVTGCAGLDRVPPSTAVPGPQLQLLSAGTLALPQQCEPTPGAVYRTNFVVARSGTVREAVPANGGGCVEEALVGWVATFRYVPLERDTESTLDWMAVVARR